MVERAKKAEHETWHEEGGDRQLAAEEWKRTAAEVSEKRKVEKAVGREAVKEKARGVDAKKKVSL